jgi:diamine N-acetyltransferase
MILRARLRESGRVLGIGARTTLREFTRADVDQWLAWPRHTDPLFHLFNPPPMSNRQRDVYYASKRNAGSVRQFAVDDPNGHLVGRINLREIDWFARTAVLGISFRPDSLGQGLGTEALQLLLEHFFHRMEMSALFLDVAAHNTRARRCYERCGFRVIGEHWGEPIPDLAGIFRDPRRADLRPFFLRDRGLVRPLLIDMAIHRADHAAQKGSS